MKSANIFLWKDYTAKLGDLNVSKVAKKGLLYTQTGTPYYASPEVWRDQPYDGKSDIWSLGCVLYETCALVPPFRADDMSGLYKRVLKGQYPPIPTHYSMELRSVIKSLVQVNAASRPTCDQILDMPVVIKRAKKYFKDDNQPVREVESECELLRTIKFSNNLFKLKLPQATYEQISFATIPIPNSQIKGSLNQRHGHGQGQKTMSVSSKSNLPKIIQIQTRNQGNLNTSTGSGDGDDEYEDDFEKEQHKIHAIKENIEVQNQKKPKSRSYSGRKELELRNQNKTPKIIIHSTNRDGEQQEVQLPLLSHRSRQSNNVTDEIQQQQTPTRHLIQSKQQIEQSTSKVQPSRILSSSASQQTLLPSYDTPQQNGTTQIIAIVKPKKQNLSIKSASTIANESTSQTIPQQTIEEKDLEDDCEPPLIQSSIKNKVVNSLSRNEGGVSLDNRTTIKRHKEKHPQICIIDDKSIVESKNLSKGTSHSIASNLINNKSIEERDRRPNHKVNEAQNRADEIQRVHKQLSQSPSNYSLAHIDGSPVQQQPNGQSKSLVNKRSVNINGNKQSPNFKRIVNIYSVNNYKKKKYLMGGQQQSLNNASIMQINNSSSLGNVNISQIQQNQPAIIYRGDDIKIKLKQLREGIGYTGKGNYLESDMEQNHSIDSHGGGGHLNHSNLNPNGSNNSIQLPELKSITPQIQNVKQHYAMVNNGSYSYNNANNSNIAKLMNRKKSYERLVRLDQQLYHLYKQGGSSQKGDTMGGYLRNGQNSYVIKSRGYQNGNGGNYSVLGGSGIANDMDVQGKSLISSKQIANHSYL